MHPREGCRFRAAADPRPGRKGPKGRYVPLANRAIELLRAQIRRVRDLHERDRAEATVGLSCPALSIARIPVPATIRAGNGCSRHYAEHRPRNRQNAGRCT